MREQGPGEKKEKREKRRDVKKNASGKIGVEGVGERKDRKKKIATNVFEYTFYYFRRTSKWLLSVIGQ